MRAALHRGLFLIFAAGLVLIGLLLWPVEAGIRWLFNRPYHGCEPHREDD